jgi:AbrB family looped-hinge helix DNA binding protein
MVVLPEREGEAAHLRPSPVDGTGPFLDLTGKITQEALMIQPATTKLSSKGQVVIPEEIRKRLGLEAGAQFVVVGEGDVVVLKALKAPRMSDFKALLDEAQKSAEAAGLTPEDVERAIREVRKTT